MSGGLTIETVELIAARAALRKDGVYTFRGVTYRVRQGRVTHYALDQKVSERCYGFLVDVGSYNGWGPDAAKKALLSIGGGA